MRKLLIPTIALLSSLTLDGVIRQATATPELEERHLYPEYSFMDDKPKTTQAPHVIKTTPKPITEPATEPIEPEPKLPENYIAPDRPNTIKYTVVKKDTLSKIAGKLEDKLGSFSWKDIVKVNTLPNPNKVEIGDIINIPVHDIYTVKKGDWLSKIAKAYQEKGLIVDYVDIKIANDLTSNTIEPGQKLVIPHCGKVKNPQTSGRYSTINDMITYDDSWNTPTKANRPNFKFNRDSPYIAMLRTLYGEVSGRPQKEVEMVIDAIVNRAQRFKWSLKKTVHKRKHFSCYNKGDPSRPRIAKPWSGAVRKKEWTRLNYILKSYMQAQKQGASNDADHYFHGNGSWKPYWAKGHKPTATSEHRGLKAFFYNLMKK